MATKIIPKLTPITPRELYFQLVSNIYDTIRYTNMGVDYSPAQYGGIFGQKVILDQSMVMEVTDFEVI
jgi:hypothetical protein